MRKIILGLIILSTQFSLGQDINFNEEYKTKTPSFLEKPVIFEKRGLEIKLDGNGHSDYDVFGKEVRYLGFYSIKITF